MTEEMTPLDRAAAAMAAAPEATEVRLAFFDRLSASELFLLLEEEAQDATIRPRVFATGEADLVLAFDREERLAAFFGGAAPFAALTGRALAGLAAAQGLGLALNPGGPGEAVIDAAGLAWLDATLAEAPEEIARRPEEIGPPGQLPERLLLSLDQRLAGSEGLARSAYLVGVTYAGGARSHLLAFVDPVPGAEPALARSVAAALTFSGLEAGFLDVGFFRASDPFCARLARVGLRFDLPEPPRIETPGAAPGTDPDRPPRLR